MSSSDLTPVRISVVVPTYKRPDALATCLAALVRQDLAPECYEVLVVDDEPSEETRAAVEWRACETAGRPAIRYLRRRPGTKGPAAARNVGWRAAQGEIIAFTDDDCVPDPGWLCAGLAAMCEGVAGASGRISVPVLHDPPTDYERMVKQLEDAPFVTANCFYRREVLERLGGFDEEFTTAWREDADLRFRAIEAGLKLVEAPGAVVVHPVRPAPWGVSVRDQKKSEFNALLYRKHPELYRQHVQSRPPLRYLGVAASLTALAAGLVSRSRALVAAGSLAWVAQTVAFSAMRLRETNRAPAHVLEMLATSAVIPPLSLYWRARGALRFRVPFV